MNIHTCLALRFKVAALATFLSLAAAPVMAMSTSDAQTVLSNNKRFMCDNVIDHNVTFDGYDAHLKAVIELRPAGSGGFYGHLVLRSDVDGVTAGQEYKVSGTYYIESGNLFFPFNAMTFGESSGSLPGNGSWAQLHGDLGLTNTSPGRLVGWLRGPTHGYMEFDCEQ